MAKPEPNGLFEPRTRKTSIALRCLRVALEERVRQRSHSSRGMSSWPIRQGHKRRETQRTYLPRPVLGTTSLRMYVSRVGILACSSGCSFGITLQLSTERLQAMLARNKDDLIRVLQNLLEDDVDRDMIEMQS